MIDLKKSLDLKKEANEIIEHIIDRTSKLCNKSLSIAPDSIESIVKAFIYTKLLTLAPLQIEKGSSDKIAQFTTKTHKLLYLRYLESIKVLEDSLLLGISGRYLTSGACLRIALESMIKGAFFFGLKSPTNRSMINKDVSNNRPCRKGKTFLEYVEDTITDNKAAENDGTVLEVGVELKMIDDCVESRLPTFKAMFDQIRDWGYFGPLGKHDKFVYDNLYKELCSYIHAAGSKTTYSHALITGQSYTAFLSGDVDKELLDRFLRDFEFTLNVVGGIYFTVAWEAFIDSESAKITKWFMDEYNAEGKPLITINLAVLQSISKAGN